MDNGDANIFVGDAGVCCCACLRKRSFSIDAKFSAQSVVNALRYVD